MSVYYTMAYWRSGSLARTLSRLARLTTTEYRTTLLPPPQAVWFFVRVDFSEPIEWDCLE